MGLKSVEVETGIYRRKLGGWLVRWSLVTESTAPNQRWTLMGQKCQKTHPKLYPRIGVYETERSEVQSKRRHKSLTCFKILVSFFLKGLRSSFTVKSCQKSCKKRNLREAELGFMGVGLIGCHNLR